jgi:hypothetical protein
MQSSNARQLVMQGNTAAAAAALSNLQKLVICKF